MLWSLVREVNNNSKSKPQPIIKHANQLVTGFRDINVFGNYFSSIVQNGKSLRVVISLRVCQKFWDANGFSPQFSTKYLSKSIFLIERTALKFLNLFSCTDIYLTWFMATLLIRIKAEDEPIIFIMLILEGKDRTLYLITNERRFSVFAFPFLLNLQFNVFVKLVKFPSFPINTLHTYIHIPTSNSLYGGSQCIYQAFLCKTNSLGEGY